MLDVGVGGGRTVPLLSRRRASYVGIDFVPELVTAASKRFPDADIRIGDARHLDFPDASFDLAVFSINGIDAISHSDRGDRPSRDPPRPAAEWCFRLLDPQQRRAWPTRATVEHASGLCAPAAFLGSNGASPSDEVPHVDDELPRSVAMNEVGPDWMITSSGAHDFGLVVHYTTASARCRLSCAPRGLPGAIELWDDRAGLPVGRARPQRPLVVLQRAGALLCRRRHCLDRGAKPAAIAVVAQPVTVTRHSWPRWPPALLAFRVDAAPLVLPSGDQRRGDHRPALCTVRTTRQSRSKADARPTTALEANRLCGRCDRPQRLAGRLRFDLIEGSSSEVGITWGCLVCGRFG